EAAQLVRRRPGGQPGNKNSVKHEAFSPGALAPRAAELEDAICSVMPSEDSADGFAIKSLALILARVEAAHQYLDARGICDGRGELRPVVAVLSIWENSARLMMIALGLTPSGRKALGLQLARGRRDFDVNLDRLDEAKRKQLADLLAEVRGG